MANFRETLWFKKGELAAADAAEPADDAPPATDHLPVEDRYLDDGSLTPTDSTAFGVHSGTTQHLAPVHAAGAAGPEVPVQALVGELRGGRVRAFAAIGASLAAACAILLLFAI